MKDDVINSALKQMQFKEMKKFTFRKRKKNKI